MRLVLIHTSEKAWWRTLDKPNLSMLLKKVLYALFSKNIWMKYNVLSQSDQKTSADPVIWLCLGYICWVLVPAP